MNDPVLSCIIPAPRKVEFAGNGKLRLAALHGIQAELGLERFAAEAKEMLNAFGVDAGSGTQNGLRIGLEPGLGPEGWRLQVGADGILLQGGDESGVFYALQALTQVVAAASDRGPAAAEIEYGAVTDSPRFGWRGFMLDPARHFQSVKTVKHVIRLMAAYRLNVLHWHLTDGQGWRFGTGAVSPETSLDLL